jgi:hypothetical protein
LLSKVILGGILLSIVGSLVFGISRFINRSSASLEAPEAESVLEAQIKLPFQVLIPAYLPKIFLREKVSIKTDLVGPQGEQMVQLVYPTRQGDTLSFFEWLPKAEEAIERKTYCKCVCVSSAHCNSVEMGFMVGALRLVAKVSTPNILSGEQARFILDTLGPAINRQIYTSLKEVPITYPVPEAVDIPINSEGVQEVTLVVTPKEYSPTHFAVPKDVPVKLIFRQIGEVGCGDQLIFQWGKNKSTTLYLASQNDIQTFEFTPGEIGDFRFNCPHLYYRGVMTVKE